MGLLDFLFGAFFAKSVVNSKRKVGNHRDSNRMDDYERAYEDGYEDAYLDLECEEEDDFEEDEFEEEDFCDNDDSSYEDHDCGCGYEYLF